MGQTLAEFCREQGTSEWLAQWDAERNGAVTPETVTYGSHRKVWWHCEKGHRWQAAVSNRVRGQGCPYCSGRRVLPEDSLGAKFPALAGQWDTEKNGDLTPFDVSPGSGRAVWWLCEKCHSWQTKVFVRTAGKDCPICAGQRVAPEETSLAVTDPELAKEWDGEKNGSLTPWQVRRGSGRKVWWRCAAGHAWKAAVNSRANRGTGCPVCAGTQVLAGFNDLASRYPLLAGEWDAEKNGTVTPADVTASSHRKVWWRCALGHGYQMRISSRTAAGSGCPYCAGQKVLPGFNDLQTAAPQVAEQWHGTLNESLTPSQVLPGSHRKVWWQCPAGHVWKASVNSRTNSHRASGCPVCAGKIRPRQTQAYARMALQRSGGEKTTAAG